MLRKLKVLYVGDLTPGGTCRARMRTFLDLGHEVDVIDTGRHVFNSIMERVLAKSGFPPDKMHANDRIQDFLETTLVYDMLWVDRGLVIRPETLAFARCVSSRPLIVSYSGDAMGRWFSTSRAYLQSVPLYDLHVTTKRSNIAELYSFGARDVQCVYSSYDEHTHAPTSMCSEDREAYGGHIGFVGRFEPDRPALLRALAEAGGAVRVWGSNWYSRVRSQKNLRIEGAGLWGLNYAKGLSNFDINLCLLSKWAGDLHTTRSVEIPACGGFMLAERTIEHAEMFEEGKEAEFFASTAEAIDKCEFYTRHRDLRQQIAGKGRERCIQSGYHHRGQLSRVLDHVAGEK